MSPFVQIIISSSKRPRASLYSPILNINSFIIYPVLGVHGEKVANVNHAGFRVH